MIQIRKENRLIKVTFPYNPDFVQRIKSIKGHHRHPEGRYWSFPNTNGTVEKILKVFEGEEIQLSPDLKTESSPSVIVRAKSLKQ